MSLNGHIKVLGVWNKLQVVSDYLETFLQFFSFSVHVHLNIANTSGLEWPTFLVYPKMRHFQEIHKFSLCKGCRITPVFQETVPWLDTCTHHLYNHQRKGSLNASSEDITRELCLTQILFIFFKLIYSILNTEISH